VYIVPDSFLLLTLSIYVPISCQSTPSSSSYYATLFLFFLFCCCINRITPFHCTHVYRSGACIHAIMGTSTSLSLSFPFSSWPGLDQITPGAFRTSAGVTCNASGCRSTHHMHLKPHERTGATESNCNMRPQIDKLIFTLILNVASYGT
jgi:hypothetical protein